MNEITKKFRTNMPLADIAKVTGDTPIEDYGTVREALSLSSGERPRVYAYLERGESAGQCVRLNSVHYLDKYGDDIGFTWMPTRTFADIVRRAR